MRNIWFFQIGLVCITATLIGCSNDMSQPPSADELADATPLRTTPPPYWVYVTNEGSGDVTFIAGDTHDGLRAIQVALYCYGITLQPLSLVSASIPRPGPTIIFLSYFSPLSGHHFLIQRGCQGGVLHQTLADGVSGHPAVSAPRAAPLAVTHRVG